MVCSLPHSAGSDSGDTVVFFPAANTGNRKGCRAWAKSEQRNPSYPFHSQDPPADLRLSSKKINGHSGTLNLSERANLNKQFSCLRHEIFFHNNDDFFYLGQVLF